MLNIKWHEINPLSAGITVLTSAKYRNIAQMHESAREAAFIETVDHCLFAKVVAFSDVTFLCAYFSFVNAEMDGNIDGLAPTQADFASKFIQKYYMYIRGTNIGNPEAECVSIW